MCHARAQEELTALSVRVDGGKQPDFLAALSQSLRAVYSCVATHHAPLAEAFGADCVPPLADALLQDASTQA